MTRDSIEEVTHCLQCIRARVKVRALYLTINRPAARNALNRAARHELHRPFGCFAHDERLRIAVGTASRSDSSCAGSDLRGKVTLAIGADSYLPGGFAGLTYRLDIDKPVIAAVDVHALGEGLEIVLACDLGVVGDHAELSIPEPLVALAALSGEVQGPARKIPHKQTVGLLRTGARIDARTALGFVLLNEVVPATCLLTAVERWVLQVMRCAPLALEATKQVARRSLAEPAPQGTVTRENPVAESILASRDAYGR